jgi:RimJ/RimL family protein N-acetyltransferase
MVPDPLLARAQSLWASLAVAPVAFTRNGTSVVASPDSQLCPASWAGIVAVGGSAIVTVPSEAMVEPVVRAVQHASPDALTDPDALRAMLPVKEVLGPANLAYVSPDAFLPAASGTVTERLNPGHPDLLALLASVSREDAEESGIGELTAPVFVARESAKVVAAAGYERWPGETAHLCVLTDTAARGRGLAQRVASAAVDRALADGLLPQWRARPPASRRVAQALGFRELGTQLSVYLDPARLAD